MPVSLTVLGSGDAFSSAGRGNAAFWIDDPAGAFCVDFGPTALMACKREGRDPVQLDAVALTHLHGDHSAGLSLLLIDQEYRARRKAELIIAGPPGTAARVALLMQATYPEVWAKGLGFPVRFQEWPVPGELRVGGRLIRALPARHDRANFACSLRVETAGRILAFSGDTGWQPELGALAADADLFVCECTDLTAGYESHLSLDDLRRESASFTARRLLLTHLGPDMRAAAPAVESEGFELAFDGQVVEL